MIQRRYRQLDPSESTRRFGALEFAPLPVRPSCERCGGIGAVQTNNGPDACPLYAAMAEADYQGTIHQ